MRTFFRLLRFLDPYRSGVVWSLLLAAASMGASVLLPWLTGRAIDALRKDDPAELKLIVVIVLAAGILRLALSVGRRLVSGQVSLGVERDLRNRIYVHLQRLELGFFADQQTGQLMSRAVVDLQVVRFFLGYGLIFLVQSALTILIAGAVMFAIKPDLAAIALAVTPVVVWVSFRYGKIARPALQEVQQRLAELSASAEENISAIRVIKAFAREPEQQERFSVVVQRVFDQSIFATRLRAFYNPLIGFLPALSLAAVLLYGGREVIQGQLTIGEFSAFYFYMLMLSSPMRTLGTTLGSAQRATAAGERIFELLDREPGIEHGVGTPMPDGNGRVEFDNVSFRYPGASRDALREVSLTVEAGETIALVGATGSGKTTMVALLPRLHDVTGGWLLVDGSDVRDIDPGALRRSVAFVAEDSFLFSSSLAENIGYADPDADLETIRAAARRAQIAGFIEALPDGYETIVGERGLTLSGGQRQRVAIARALVADPRLLILDDATSSVDARTEDALKEALAEVMRGRTTFIVAHRLSTIALADRVAVLEDGRLVAVGTHDELLGQSSLYRAIATKGTPDAVFLTEQNRESA